MQKDLPDEPIASTRVWHNGRCWDVSTIDRRSSVVAEYDCIYAETIVWDVDSSGSRGRIVHMAEGARGSIRVHQETVERLHRTGRYEEPEDDEGTET